MMSIENNNQNLHLQHIIIIIIISYFGHKQARMSRSTSL
jgi:hypothetical protein